MTPIEAHITALIEEYDNRIKKISNSALYQQCAFDRAEGAKDELEEVIEDLKCVLNAVDK